MEGCDKGVGKFGAIALEGALEGGEDGVLFGKVDDELGKGLVAYANVVFELGADLGIYDR